MKWIIFYQNSHNRIVYLTSNNYEDKDSMNYYDFLNYVYTEFPVRDIEIFKEKIDSFKTIMLYDNGDWEIIVEETPEATFEQMYELNKEDEENKTAFDKQLDKSKTFLNSIFSFRKQDKRFNYGSNKDRRKR